MSVKMFWEMNDRGHEDPTAEAALANIERRQTGLQSRIAGEYFEKIIEASLIWYRQSGRAHIEKTPEPMKPLSRPNRKGQFLACYVKAAQPDFKGTLAGGRSVVFEAKHTDGDRIEYGRVTPEQGDALELHHRLGALAFVLVSVGLQDFYRIPWTIWRDMKAIYSRKHIKVPELEQFRVPFMAGVIKMLDGEEVNGMAARTYMHEYRERNGITLEEMAQKCRISKNLLSMLESCDSDVTHPKIAERIGEAYELTAEQIEKLMPENYRKSSPNYDPDRYREEDDE